MKIIALKLWLFAGVFAFLTELCHANSTNSPAKDHPLHQRAAQLRALEPPQPASETNESINAQEVDHIRTLLTSEQHLTSAVIKMMDFTSNSTNPHREQFEKQKDALRKVGKYKLVEFVPQLIIYLDYPVDYVRSSVRPPLRANPVEASTLAWPAFDAILKIGKPAIPYLQQFIRDGQKQLEYRIAALESLRALDVELSNEEAIHLLSEIRHTDQTNVVSIIENVIQGKQGFWGVRSTNREPLK